MSSLEKQRRASHVRLVLRRYNGQWAFLGRHDAAAAFLPKATHNAALGRTQHRLPERCDLQGNELPRVLHEKARGVTDTRKIWISPKPRKGV